MKRAKFNPPKNEDVARALSFFTGPSGEEEVKELIAEVTNTVSDLGEVNDPDTFRRCAEPLIIGLIFKRGSKEEEVRAGLVKLFKFQPVLW